MPGSSEANVPARTVIVEEVDRSTTWLLWAVFGALMMLVALLVYAWLTGGFGEGAPRTAQEQALAASANSIKRNPKNGAAWATRAEIYYHLGRKQEAFNTLAQGEKAVAGQNPGLLYILRTWTALLVQERKFSEAEKVGQRGMSASDDYLARQGAALASKQVTAIGGNLQTQTSVDMAMQLAAVYMGEQKYDKALELYTYALRLDPLAGDVRALRGFAYLAKGDKVKAKADFEQTLKYLPNDPVATRGMQQVSQ